MISVKREIGCLCNRGLIYAQVEYIRHGDDLTMLEIWIPAQSLMGLNSADVEAVIAAVRNCVRKLELEGDTI